MSKGEEAVLISCPRTFTEAAIRRGFVWKVYGILTAQLVVTMAIVGFFYIPTVVDYAISNNWLFWANFSITFSCLISLALKILFV
jgi:FtsH-binding integral membrane protein